MTTTHGTPERNDEDDTMVDNLPSDDGLDPLDEGIEDRPRDGEDDASDVDSP